jgi:hypothetical protein
MAWTERVARPEGQNEVRRQLIDANRRARNLAIVVFAMVLGCLCLAAYLWWKLLE